MGGLGGKRRDVGYSAPRGKDFLQQPVHIILPIATVKRGRKQRNCFEGNLEGSVIGNSIWNHRHYPVEDALSFRMAQLSVTAYTN